MNRPLVHVLVINWNGLEHLEECFSSLLASTYPNARFVLIDNGSTDGSAAFVRSRYETDGRVQILELESNLGWSRGNNVGIRQAIAQNADYVLLLNNDTATAPDAIQKLVEMAEGNPRVGAVAPKMLMYDNPDLLNSVGLECSLIASSWDLGIGRLDGPRWNDTRPVIGVCGGAGFFRVATLKEAGLLPEDFEIYLDDLDLCLRIWDAGYEIRSCPDARVRHKFSATMGQGKQYRRKYYLNTRNRLYVILRNYPIRKALPVGLAFVAGEMRATGRALLDGEPWRALAHVRSWAAGVGYVPRAIRHRARRREHPPDPLQRGNESSGFQRGNESSGFQRGNESSEFQRGNESSEFQRGNESSEFQRGNESSGFQRGNKSSGIQRGNKSSGLQRGNETCRFWHLIRTDRMFFHGTKFPINGWYAPRKVRGKIVRPMSARATLDVEAGSLRVTHLNCYPALGQTCVEVFSNDHRITSLETLDSQECVLEVPAGRLTFLAKRIFEAEDTGEKTDLGGWIAVERPETRGRQSADRNNARFP
jgi:hypothetical protein